MIKTHETQQPNLEAMIRGLPEEPMADDLAKRIVARTISLPQQPRREDQVAIVTEATTKERVTLRSGRWFKPTMAAALAASFALLLLNVPGGRMRPNPPASVEASPREAEAKPVDNTPKPVTTEVAEVTRPQPQATHEPDKRRTVAVTPSIPPEIHDAVAPGVETAATNSIEDEVVEELAAAKQPNLPVQGPPVPDELRYGHGGSGVVTGLGVAGDAPSPVSVSATPPGDHPPPPPR